MATKTKPYVPLSREAEYKIFEKILAYLDTVKEATAEQIATHLKVEADSTLYITIWHLVEFEKIEERIEWERYASGRAMRAKENYYYLPKNVKPLASEIEVAKVLTEFPTVNDLLNHILTATAGMSKLATEEYIKSLIVEVIDEET